MLLLICHRPSLLFLLTNWFKSFPTPDYDNNMIFLFLFQFYSSIGEGWVVASAALTSRSTYCYTDPSNSYPSMFPLLQRYESTINFHYYHTSLTREGSMSIRCWCLRMGRVLSYLYSSPIPYIGEWRGIYYFYWSVISSLLRLLMLLLMLLLLLLRMLMLLLVLLPHIPVAINTDTDTDTVSTVSSTQLW